MIDINQMLSDLAIYRPVFHSEADFQHCLAWHIHSQFPDYSIRLEYPFKPEEGFHLDIFVSYLNHVWAIELKYRTKQFFNTIKGEMYYLKNHSALDQGRFDFLWDIKRLEEYASNKDNITGYAVFLTNDSGYWNPPRTESTLDANFRIHEDKLIHGSLNLDKQAAEGTTRGKIEPIHIEGTYRLSWKDYSQVEAFQNAKRPNKFRYLLVEVKRLANDSNLK